MKVTILEPSGYCSGVEHAMNLALKTKLENPSNNVVILGMLVHNHDSLEMLKKHGINSIYGQNCSLEQLIDEILEPSIVILTAHGHDKNIEKLLLDKGHKIVDATCPFVKKSFNEITNALKEKTVFYIGVQNHPESNAALSISNKIVFIDIKDPVIPRGIKGPIFVISQTTLSKYEIKDVLNQIKKLYKDTYFVNGICNASTNRQEAIMNISDDIDLVLVVGGNNSNNSKTLYNLALNCYPEKIVKLIENETQINKKDLIGLSHIAIASGASTPKETILKIKDKLLN